jgi:hypothetical protein
MPLADTIGYAIMGEARVTIDRAWALAITGGAALRAGRGGPNLGLAASHAF